MAKRVTQSTESAQIITLTTKKLEKLLPLKIKKIILVLTDNTKINLEVVLKNKLVKQVILDGSNFPYLKNRWMKTCKKFKIPFYDLQTKGPFLFTSESGDIAF